MRKKYITKLIVVSLLVFSVMMFSGLGSFLASAQEKITLTAWLWGRFPEQIPKHTNPTFLAKYPNVEIEFVNMPGDALRKKIMIAITTQTEMPNLTATQDWRAVTYFANDMAEDLTDLIPADEFMPYKVEVSTYNGRLYGVPLDPAPAVMAYRTDIYADAGIDIETVNIWKDFLDSGKKISALPGDIYPLNLPQEGIWYNLFEIMMHSYGTSIYDKDLNVIFDSPKMVEAIEMYKELYDSGIASDFGTTRGAGWTAALTEGKLATIIMACWYVGSAKARAPDSGGSWQLRKTPVGRSGFQTFQGGTTFFIPKGAEYKELVAEYLMDFHKYGALPMCQETGIRPSYLPILEDPYFNAPDPYYGGQLAERFILDQVSKIALGVVYYTPVWAEARDAISSGLAPFIAGEITAEEAAANIAAEIEALE